MGVNRKDKLSCHLRDFVHHLPLLRGVLHDNHDNHLLGYLGRVLHVTETESSADLSSSLTNSSVTSMTVTLCYHPGDLFHRLPLLDVLHDQLVKHLLLDVLHDHLVTHPLLDVLHDHLVKHLLLPILDVLHEL